MGCFTDNTLCSKTKIQRNHRVILYWSLVLIFETQYDYNV